MGTYAEILSPELQAFSSRGLVTETAIISVHHLSSVADYSILYIGKYSYGNETISWKYQDCPAVIALIFGEDEKRVEENPERFDDWEEDSNEDTDSDGYVLEYVTTVGKAIERLTSKGLTNQRVKKMAANALNVSVRRIEHGLHSRENGIKEFENGELSYETVLEELDILGCPEIAELLQLWAALEKALPSDQVTFDPSSVLWDEFTPAQLRKRDFLKEARDSLRRHLDATSSVLDFLRKPTPDAIQYAVNRIGSLNEKDLLNRVIIPVLESERYENVKAIGHHGPYEFGSDTQPMRRCHMGKWEYVAVQTKARRLDSKSATVAWAQVETALGVQFPDSSDNIPKRLEKVLLFLANGATPEAMKFLTEKSHGRPVKIFDSVEIARLVLEHDLVGNLVTA